MLYAVLIIDIECYYIMKINFCAFPLMSTLLLLNLAGCKPDHLKPVSNFELKKYLGKWYEIARLPNWFEKEMVNVTATYSLKDNGKVKVENAGIQKGEPQKAVGKAKFAGDNRAGYLKVSFFGPFYADYKILDLDTSGYQYAMVASSNQYLWILCREPKMDSALLERLTKKADSLGFDISKLFHTPQEVL